jgi:hypothetical protein
MKHEKRFIVLAVLIFTLLSPMVVHADKYIR